VTAVLEPYNPVCNMLHDSITLRMTGLQRPDTLVLSWLRLCRQRGYRAAEGVLQSQRRGLGLDQRATHSREGGKMSDNSPIEWTDATWNPVTGCTQVSPGCDHCNALIVRRMVGVRSTLAALAALLHWLAHQAA
jgi:Protein of unknown function (DUF5131)